MKYYVEGKDGKFHEIAERCTQVYYKKGKDYKPIGHYIDAFNYYREGDYLLHVTKSGKLLTTSVFKDKVGLQAAFNIVRDKLPKVILDATKAKPIGKVSEKGCKLYDKFMKETGHEFYGLSIDSAGDIVDKIEEFIMEGV